MEKDYWLSRWDTNDVKFHKHDITSYLLEYFLLLNLKEGDHVFVPLCGKTNDMLWLQEQGLQVTGVELSSKACHDFFTENQLEYSMERESGYIKYTSEYIQLFCGDLFEFSKKSVKKINAVYDNAALIALPLEYRQRYAQKMIELLDAGSMMLLVSLETSIQTNSPPFSVAENEIDDLYGEHFEISLLGKFPDETQHLLAKGYKDLVKVVYLLTRK